MRRLYAHQQRFATSSLRRRSPGCTESTHTFVSTFMSVVILAPDVNFASMSNVVDIHRDRDRWMSKRQVAEHYGRSIKDTPTAWPMFRLSELDA